MDRERRRQVKIVTAFMALNVLSNSLMDVCDMGTSTTTVQRGSGSLHIPSSIPAWIPIVAILGVRTYADALLGRKKRRRFWSALRGQGVWETDFLRNYPLMTMQYRVPDFENAQYIDHLRMGKEEFWRFHEEFGRLLARKDTKWRASIPSHKRLAITLHWLAHGPTFRELARQYAIGKSTAVHIVHSTVDILFKDMAPRSIRFPEGKELKKTMQEFEDLAKLERCGGAVDGTFMKIKKPQVQFADCYWCYKKYSAIIILGTVDACGLFLNVNAGRAGSAGDASVYASSRLARKIGERKWLTIKETETEKFTIQGSYIRPYLVGDSAFPLSATLMKCYDDNAALLPWQRTFNYRLIRTRRVVEQAFGRLKGRFRVLVHNNLNDPEFASRVAIVCCAIHNVCERWRCPVEATWLIDDATYDKYHPGPNDQPNAEFDQAGLSIRNKLAQYTHQQHPIA
ncbi:uncharacterized protein LOC135828714 [Sycon ciliatum]|uniref:uncharacterized protein LOC135828714 n=1 Tax=Sycon ciliatum TaxID=27933 RepID=UPI0031F684CB